MDKFVSKYIKLSKDLFAMVFIILLGCVLVGYYLQYDYFITGYQDWIYHAFRIKSIDTYGLVSWDHKWANGLNYWRSYQYYPHLLTLFIKNLLSLSVTKAMILTSITVFIYLRLATYLLLRYEKVPARESLLVVALTFLSSHQWAIKDFSIFIALIILPIFMFFWILSTRESRYYTVAASLSGLSWMLHPVVGLATTSLIMTDIFLNRSLDLLRKFGIVLLFVVSSASFWFPYIFSGYKFSHPFLQSTEFVRLSSGDQTFGLGVIFFISLAFAWVTLALFSKKLSYWVKILILHSTLACAYFYLAREGHLPRILNVFQFQRSNVFFSFMLPFLLGPTLSIILKKARNRFTNIIASAIFAILFVLAVDFQGSWSPVPVSKIDHNLPTYFNEKKSELSGSIYYSNESEFSFFSEHDIRLVGSYNEHLLPSPTSSIFKFYMTRIESSSVVTQETIEKLSDYMSVLGVEYLVVGHHSPIAIESKAGYIPFLEEVDVIKQGNESFSILRNRREIHNAYIIDKSSYETLDDSMLEKPTLNNNSYNVWDEKIGELSDLINSEKAIPATANYKDTDKIEIILPEYSNVDESVLLITNNYSDGWFTKGLEIKATNLNFILIDIDQEDVLLIEHKWPSWHWLVQFISPGVLLFNAILIFLYTIFEKSKLGKQ